MGSTDETYFRERERERTIHVQTKCDKGLKTGPWPSWVLPDPRESPSNFLSKSYHHIHQNPQSTTDLASLIFLLYPSKPAIYNRLRWVLFFFFNPFLQLTTERKKCDRAEWLASQFTDSTQLRPSPSLIPIFLTMSVSQFLFLESIFVYLYPIQASLCIIS